MRYYLIAGEASGDLHGAALMRGLKEADPQAGFRFRGGDAMKAEGGTLFRHYGENAVMGFSEVMSKAGRILADLHSTEEDVVSWKPDVLILIDFPAFNLRVARYAHKRGIKVFWYIAPKLWARGERRIRQIRKYVDGLFVIFPFEVDYFARLGVKAHYYGNPLVDSVGEPQGECPFPTPDGSPVIALLPGSRSAELKWMMPRFAQMEKLMEASGKWKDYRLVIAGVDRFKPEDYAAFLPANSRIEVRYGATCDLLREATAAVVCSGTASLEAALMGVPQTVCYGFSRITWILAKMAVKIKQISLPNIILGRPAVRELLQDGCTPEKMLEELDRLVNDAACRAALKADYAELRSKMEKPGAASRLASGMFQLLKENG
ncbi:MAG: lipid-A-disaccharide synthase [Bacteroidales bacterium]|nr:lipid-A-disaccharide synthase [Bacteroidales bacterium]